MSDDNNPPQSPRSPRRSSFAGQALSDLFGTGRPSMSRGTTDSPPTMPTASSPPAQPVGPISRAAQQAQQRRMSLTTLGLSGSPTQSSAFANYRTRGESIGSSNATSQDESAIAEDDAPSRDVGNGGSPTNTPFQRRTSFGARALRDIRSGSLSGQPGTSPGSPGSNGTSSTPSSNDATKKNAQKYGSISSRDAKGRGSSEGFNWADNFRSRAERTSSISGQSGPLSSGGVALGMSSTHSRAKSVAVMEPPPVTPPKPKERPRPDPMQERILKGDFYMD